MPASSAKNATGSPTLLSQRTPPAPLPREVSWAGARNGAPFPGNRNAACRGAGRRPRGGGMRPSLASLGRHWTAGLGVGPFEPFDLECGWRLLPYSGGRVDLGRGNSRWIRPAGHGCWHGRVPQGGQCFVLDRRCHRDRLLLGGRPLARLLYSRPHAWPTDSIPRTARPPQSSKAGQGPRNALPQGPHRGNGGSRRRSRSGPPPGVVVGVRDHWHAGRFHHGYVHTPRAEYRFLALRLASPNGRRR